MNKPFLCLVLIISVFANDSFSQSGQWLWMKGDTLFDQWLHAPVIGVEDSTYYPPSLYLSSGWTDDSGMLWMFGGLQYDDDGDPGWFDILWRFNPSTNSWAAMRASIYFNSIGEYGIQGIPDSSNYPGSRGGATIWKDQYNNIWLFGGTSAWGNYNDLWKYDMNTNIWTWMKGPNQTNVNGIYGQKGVASPYNFPPGRRESAHWMDTDNNLWLFGGYAFIIPGFGDTFYGDLWMYNTSSNEWTWVGGTDTTDHSGIYGTKGIADTNNFPSARSCSCSWMDESGNFYLFAGSKIVDGTHSLNDVWKYNKEAKEWTWLKGSAQFNESQLAILYCMVDSISDPGGRIQPSCVSLDQNHLLMFGGKGFEGGGTPVLRDAWIYNINTNQWSRVWGDSSQSAGNYGIQGMIDSTNDPRSRHGAVGWKGISNDVWFYGGNYGVFSFAESDLWKYTIDTTCLVPTVEGTKSNYVAEDLEIFPNPTKDYLTLKTHSTPPNSSIQVLSLTGSLLLTQKLSSISSTINISPLSPGIYLLVVESKDRTQVLKIVKE